MGWFKNRRRNKIAARPFPDEWLNVLQDDVPIYNRLNDADRMELRRHIQIFMAEKEFEGCNGFKITDWTRVIIAAYACVLLLHRRTDYYPGLYTILVYPDAFIAPNKEYLPGGIVVEGPEVLSGQSWHRGTVILSWADIQLDIADMRDGRNVIFHEFAHQIDTSGGAGDNSAVLKSNASFAAWAEVLHEHYLELKDAAEFYLPCLLDEYGAESPAEFFAVATEFFFEKPIEMKSVHPELYDELMRFYNQDPSELI
ncbi:MAG: zinc-dependent peptidase [Planctomycetaceae bacterium]|nr:zinc-dependent peptidase [Planctomycetaceae bacterium]